jgi:hypothetical protein
MQENENPHYDYIDTSMWYHCPECGAPRVREESRKTQMQKIITLFYDCGSIRKIYQTAYRYQTDFARGEKCVS